MELKYGNEFRKSCVDWVVNNSLTRPHLASSMSPTEFDSASATLSQLIMQHYDNQDVPNPNTDVFYELLSSGNLEGQNFAKYLVGKIIQLNSRGDEAEYVRLRTLLDSMTFPPSKGKTLKIFSMHCEI